MFIGGEERASPTGTTLSPTSVSNEKKIAGRVRSVRQFTETANSNNTTAVDMFVLIRLHTFHALCIVIGYMCIQKGNGRRGSTCYFSNTETIARFVLRKLKLKQTLVFKKRK